MSKDFEHNNSRLRAIAETLGMPTNQLFLDGAKADGLFGAHECIRLFLSIQTEDSRRRAIEFLRQIADSEQP